MKNNKLIKLIGLSATLLSLATFNSIPKANANEAVSTVGGSNCRKVNRNIPVRTKPMGPIIGALSKNQQVLLANEGNSGWVPIEAPISGYIPSQYLGQCTTPMADSFSPNAPEAVTTVAGTNCRLVLSPDTPVRSVPKGPMVGEFRKNQRVYIANEGVDGWVPVESPASGYVASPNLGQCL